MYKNIFTFLLAFLAINVINAQNFGIRAGLNYSKFSGPSETDGTAVVENFKLTNGFHFGVNYSYPFANRLAVKGELVYTQLGTQYEYEGESYYRIFTQTDVINEKGHSIMELKISNAYISVPVTLQWTVSKKFEFNAGLYANILIQPRGAGQLRFTSYERPNEIRLKQTLEHNYNKDIAQSGSLNGPTMIIDGKPFPLFKNTGAYYQFLPTEVDGSYLNTIDYGFTGGVSYYFTKGFYSSLRYDYGFTDMTRNGMDPSRRSLDDNGKFIFKNDFDRHIAFQISFGFKF